MDNILLNKIKSIIRNDTGLGSTSISAADIHDKLTAAGVEAPKPSVAEALERLEKERLVTIVRQVKRADVKQHGAYVITWVSEKL